MSAVLLIETVPGAPLSSIPTTPASDDGVSAAQTPLELELATLLVESLNLEVAPAEVDPNAPLYGEGLGLDSIDILEVALEVSRRYGFQLRSDDERNQQIFQSLRTLATHVAQNRTPA
jgi:acyl carrier protein